VANRGAMTLRSGKLNACSLGANRYAAQGRCRQFLPLTDRRGVFRPS